MFVNSTFKPAWWLKNKHLQTIVPRFYSIPSYFNPHHQEFDTHDGDFVELTWTQNPTNIKPEQPIILILHGLEGSFDSFYTKRMMNAVHNQGWVAVLMHFRGCGKKPNRMAHSYHSGQTEDVAELVAHLRQQFPSSPLYGVGFSLGGNVLAKYNGETENPALDGAIVISAPLELSVCSDAIANGFSRLYQKYLVDKLKNSTRSKINYLEGIFPIPVRVEELEDILNIRDFDNLITAPLNGFVDADDYYLKCSGRQFLASITTPTLIIHAKDDPFMTPAVIPDESELSPVVQFELCSHGGHVGFITGNNPLKPEFWLQTRCIDYITTLLETKI